MIFRLEKEMTEPVLLWLQAQGYLCVTEMMIIGYCDIVAGRYGLRVGRRRPRLVDVVTVELKLDDIGGVFSQAEANRLRAPIAYAALPATRCQRLRGKTKRKFEEAGIGILSVGEIVVELVAPRPSPAVFPVRLEINLWRRVSRSYRTLVVEETKGL